MQLNKPVKMTISEFLGVDTISHAHMVLKLANHGITPSEDTEYNPYNGQLVLASSFYDAFGEREHYQRADVLGWLGY